MKKYSKVYDHMIRAVAMIARGNRKAALASLDDAITEDDVIQALEDLAEENTEMYLGDENSNVKRAKALASVAKKTVLASEDEDEDDDEDFSDLISDSVDEFADDEAETSKVKRRGPAGSNDRRERNKKALAAAAARVR
jgi:hypothetical protein